MKNYIITITNHGAVLYEVDSEGGEHFVGVKPLRELRVPDRIPAGQCGIDIGWTDYPFAKVINDLRWRVSSEGVEKVG